MATIKERREVQGFNEVLLRGTGEIDLKQGDEESLVVEAEESILPKIRTEVRSGRLMLEMKSWMDYLSLAWKGPIRYHLTVKTLRGVSISGSGNLSAERVQTDTLQLEVSGSGKVEIGQLEAQSLRFSISGAGKAELSGRVHSQDLRISGSGNYRAEDLESEEANVRISGSGEVYVHAAQTLKVTISGSGDVRYLGQPQVSQRISGSGQVQQVSR